MNKKAIGLCLLGLLGLVGCQGVLPSLPIARLPIATPQSLQAQVKLGDITLHYEIYGQGKPLILLHGGGGSTRDWSNQIPTFAQFYRVIALDSRGQGRTTEGKVPWTYHLMAEDTLHLMDYLNIPAADVVGWSDGGIIALDLAIHHPDRLKAIVAFGANTSPEGLPDLDVLRQAIKTNEQQLASAHSKAPQTTEQKLRILWTTQPHYSDRDLANIQVPTLILQGVEDQEIRLDHVQSFAKKIPTAKLIVLSGLGHDAPAADPRTWNHIVLNFLKNY